MKGDDLPGADHISRYCGYAKLNEDGSAAPGAFMLGPGHEHLSVHWLEFFRVSDRDQQIQCVRDTAALKRGSTAKFAVMNVGEVKEYVRQESSGSKATLQIRHWPSEDSADDVAHSGIFDIPDSGESLLVAQLIADCVLECQRRSKISPPGRSKTSPLNVMRYAVLGGCPGSP